MAVFDTDVLAYALLGAPQHREASATALESAAAVHVPDVALTELAHVVGKWVVARGLPIAEAHRTLDLGRALVTDVVPAAGLWHAALDIATAGAGRTDPGADACFRGPCGIYDGMLVALAVLRDEPLLTFDTRLLHAFPELARRPGSK